MTRHAADRATIVYRATNAINGHTYIGLTTQGLSQRVKDHRRVAARGEGWLLHAAMRKYGAEQIKFEVVHDFDDDEELAKLYEIEAIAKYRPEYNISRGGDGGTVHPDTARKISEANKGRPSPFKGTKWTDESKAKMREAKRGRPGPWAGKKRSKETVEKIRLANTGKPSPLKGRTHSAEVRQRMAEAARRRKPWVRTEAHKSILHANALKAHAAIRKQVVCLNDGTVFESARAASLFYGWTQNKVSKIITNQIKNHPSGLRFAYLPKDEN